MFDGIRKDIRYACRWLLRSPGFAVVAIVSLGLGIGANTAIFAVLDALLLRPLAVAEPGRLVDVYSSTAEAGAETYSTNSLLDLRDLSAQAPSLEGIIGYTPMFAPVTGGERTRMSLGEMVTGNCFQLLGVPAKLGRTLLPEDDLIGAPATAVISEAYWRREFGADPLIIGRSLHMRGAPYTIVGVINGAYSGMLPMLAPQLWTTVQHHEDVTPAGLNDVVPSPTGTNRLDRRGTRWLFAKARLKPGASVDQARAELEVAAAQLAATYPQTNKARRVIVRPSSTTRAHPAADRVLTWVGAGTMATVGLVLLIACANVAGMLLARASSREREISIRLALGAGSGRVMRQLLVESVLLAGLGGTMGVALTWWLTRLLVSVDLSLPVPLALDLRIDGRVLAFTVVIAVGTGILAGLAPAFRVRRVDLLSALKGELTAVRAGGRRWTLRDGLVIGQMAVTTVLLVIAGLLLRSLLASQRADVGFKADGLALIATDTDLARFTRDRSNQFFDDAVRRIGALPGVESVALSTRQPFSINSNHTNIAIPDRQRSADEIGSSFDSAQVSPEYFSTLGVALVQGRAFTAQDLESTPRVAIVNETMARKYWPAGNAIGQRVFERTLSSGRSFEIVGVTADHKLHTVGEAALPAIYFPIGQRPQSYRVIIARTRGDEHALLAEMRRTLLGMEPSLLFFEDLTMREQVSAILLPVRAGAMLVSLLSGFGLLLAAIGLYGVIAFSVARRAREIGIRMAIGAPPRAVLAMIMRHGLTMAAIGLAIGGMVSAAVARFLAGVLFGVAAADPWSWSLAAVVLFAVAGLANFIPAARAMRIDPSRVLRAD